MTVNISREACQQAHAMLCINGLPETARLVTALRDALDRAENREAEARKVIADLVDNRGDDVLATVKAKWVAARAWLAGGSA